jgi:hypothetical protein
MRRVRPIHATRRDVSCCADQYMRVTPREDDNIAVSIAAQLFRDLECARNDRKEPANKRLLLDCDEVTRS